MDGHLVTIESQVFDRQRWPRWAVTATFAAVDGSEPRCVDYRVRVVPDGGPGTAVRHLHETLGHMSGAAMTPTEAELLGSIPPEGIPRYVFERASQARLLADARAAFERNPQRFEAPAAEMLARVPVSRAGQVRRGRPPAIPLGVKLRILADIEQAYSNGGTRADVARRYNMSESSVRDLLTWARHVAEPQLFTIAAPGTKEGRMTAEARSMLEQGVE